MARSGDVLTLHDGETVTIRTATAEMLELDAVWRSADHKPPAHFHPSQDERFEVHEGALSVRLDGRTHVVRAGESFEVPRGVAHAMWTEGPGATRATWQIWPALRSADFFAYVDALHGSGRTGKGGFITPLGAGMLLQAFPAEFRLALPGLIQRPAVALLAGLARLRGYPRPGLGGS